ncbi:DUF3977 family protein [Lactococcus allomyrinae]|uniref:DUF3977 family protein n=1 Tax=Lactococcus allomyrinae TaxID=2419773 RepID=A0A387B8Q7_9LACT|nr:DUF3977 family protein [Lactococcus allomyrinae]AYG00073.1 DUF3977 family protein [Lactococcus allomyrinae]
MNKIFIEIGFDLDNNRFGFGRSVEIEHADGTEKRLKISVKPDKLVSRYVRIWLGKTVLIFDSQSPHFSVRKKTRRNFKFVIGKWGEKG